MARKPRIHFPGALYHVIARGNQKQDIFVNEDDYRHYLSYLSEYKARYHFNLFAYALMKNHIHLLLQVEEIPLSKIMHVTQFRYTRYFNKRYEKVGHLFQGRYKAILCDKDGYLLELIRYIHLNPVRAQIVDCPDKYPWTAHLIYLGKVKNDLVDQNVVLCQFDRSRTQARKAYLKFVLGDLEGGHKERFYMVKDQIYLGEDRFVEEIQGKRSNLDPRVYDIPVEEIASEVSRVTGIPKEKLYSMTRDRSGAFGRGIVAYLARRISGYLVKDIAEYFRREPMTISQAIIKLERIIHEDSDLEKMVRSLESSLVMRGKRKYLISIA